MVIEDDGNSTTSDGTVESSEFFSIHLNSGVHPVFKTPQLCPKQDAAIKRILLDDKLGGKLIVVDRTAGGEFDPCNDRNFFGG